MVAIFGISMVGLVEGAGCAWIEFLSHKKLCTTQLERDVTVGLGLESL